MPIRLFESQKLTQLEKLAEKFRRLDKAYDTLLSLYIKQEGTIEELEKENRVLQAEVNKKNSLEAVRPHTSGWRGAKRALVARALTEKNANG